jgi:hypothetical protein
MPQMKIVSVLLLKCPACGHKMPYADLRRYRSVQNARRGRRRGRWRPAPATKPLARWYNQGDNESGNGNTVKPQSWHSETVDSPIGPVSYVMG